jgi:hypothetical protein
MPEDSPLRLSGQTWSVVSKVAPLARRLRAQLTGPVLDLGGERGDSGRELPAQVAVTVALHACADGETSGGRLAITLRLGRTGLRAR